MGNALTDVLLRLPSDAVLQQAGLRKGVMEMVGEERMFALRKELKGLEETLRPGGAACNTVRALSHLGAQTGFIGKIGTDSSGVFYEEAIRKAGVTPYLIQSEGMSGSCTALISPDGERTMATFLGPAPEIRPEELPEDMFSSGGYLYIEGYLIVNEPLMRAAMRMAHRQGAQVALDLANFNIVNVYKPLLAELIPQEVDLLFCNESEAEAFTGLPADKAAIRLAEQTPTVVVTVGKEGAIAVSRGEVRRIAAQEVRPVDTTGAGDHFAAGFLYGCVTGATLEQSGRLGALLAAYAIGVVGTEIPEENWEDIRRKAANILAGE
jgi:sugar/nucleoside kinase (ribokinase family)